jgi:hypothetical protein
MYSPPSSVYHRLSIPDSAFQVLLLAAVPVAPDGPVLHGVDSGALGRKLGQLGFSFIAISGPETLGALLVNPILDVVRVPSEALNAVHTQHGSFLSFSGIWYRL